MKLKMTLACLSLFALSCASSGEPSLNDEPSVAKSTATLFAGAGVTLWGTGAHIPVCFTTNGFDLEKQLIKSAVRMTWETYGNVVFDWRDLCPTAGLDRYVRVLVELGSDSGGGGSSARGTGALMWPTTNTSARSVHIALPLSGSVGRTEYLAVHEFGHVLGFSHEQDRSDNTSTEPYCNPDGSEAGTTYTTYDRESVMHYCNSGGNSSGRLSVGDKAGIAKAYGSARGGMIVSDTNFRLAMNAYGGAFHGAYLRLVDGCSRTNTDCTWTYRNGMILSNTNPRLAVNAYGGAQHGTRLRLVEGCTSTNTDCTWTYRNGRFVSDTNPNLSINAYGGATHGTYMTLVNNCPSNNTDCTWTHVNSMIQSDTNSALAMNAYGGAAQGTALKLVSNCPPDNSDCLWTLSKGLLQSATNPALAMNAYGGAQHLTQLLLVEGCPSTNTDCTWTFTHGRIQSDTRQNLAMNAYGGAMHLAPLRLVDNCPQGNTDCSWGF